MTTSPTPGRPRCLVIAPVSESVRYIIAPELATLRREVDFRILCSDGDDVAALRLEGWDVVTVRIERKLTPWQDLATLLRLIREVRRYRPQILHTYMPKGGLLGQLAGMWAGIPLRLHSCRGLLNYEEMPAWQGALLRLTDRVTFGLATRVLFVSRADRAAVVEASVVAPSKAVWTGNGIDLDRFRAPGGADEMRRETRRRLGFEDDQQVLLTVGRFVADKGYREIAEAASMLRGTHPRARWLWLAPAVTGEGGVLPLDLPVSMGVDDVVTVLDRKQDPLPLYLAADILVHASYREGIPRAVMEGSACGLPIVATDIPGCREILDGGGNSVLVASRDANALAAGVAQLLDDPVRRAAMGSASRSVAAERCDVRQVVVRVRGEYGLVEMRQ
ncbi:MAG: glycosyltransferase [Gemmatimonadales bacterium]